MAELAAKLRAKFRRRNSANPSVPSLSSSHGSSLFRRKSYGHNSHGSICDPGPDPDRDPAGGEGLLQRVGSSRVSANDEVHGDLDQRNGLNGYGSTHGHTEDDPPPLPALPALPEGAGQPAAVANEAQAQAGDGDETVDAAPLAKLAKEAAQQQTSDYDAETGREGPSSARATDNDSSNDASAASADVPVISGGIDESCTSATNAIIIAVPPAPPPAALTADTPAVPVPLICTSSSASTTAATLPSTIPAVPESTSDMSGNDRQVSSLRRLSIVNEQPSPDTDVEGSVAVYVDAAATAADNDDAERVEEATQVLPQPQPQPQPEPQPHTVTLEPEADLVLDDSTRPLALPATSAPPFVASATAPVTAAVVAAAPSTETATSPRPKKRNDANLRLPPTSPRTPGLGPTTPSRPHHIHLPPASFAGPSPKLSPGGALYSNTAPTSPLRHSTLAPQPPPTRRQSLLAKSQSTLVQALLRESQPEASGTPNPDRLLPFGDNMGTRKIWVKRPQQSATLVTITDDDLVDDVREMILRKYANSLGRQFDAPDLILRIRPTGNQQDRMLGPEEPMSRTLDAYFPGGQTIDDALVIEVPARRTPRASPRVNPSNVPHIQYYVEDPRPPETAGDYFGPGALSALPVTVTAPSAGSSQSHAISVLTTGQVPQIPSPGGRRARDYKDRPERPRLGRQHTSSPTLINLASGATHQGSIASAAAIVPHDVPQVAPQPPALPTPPAAELASAVPQHITTPPPRVSSPRPKKSKKKTDHPMLPKGMLNGSVPPINVLIVEDNIINLKLLEAFVKRLKVRWSTAMNGRDAVTKWRGGGFHLVLMDIQLPIMSGLDATREIRRLERVNSIGVFSSAASSAPEEVKGEPDEPDKLENKDLFKSPVIIVALTASSLQSDRHEALAAGCNDFLTKPVNFVWLERKVMEWGCMQALIDFDGWRKWKDFSSQQVDDRAAKAAALKAKSKKNRSSLGMAQAVAAGA
ncbi:unnamed protein product [Discula destructiva]